MSTSNFQNSLHYFYSRISSLLFRSIDIAPLIFFRIVCVTLMACEFAGQMLYAPYRENLTEPLYNFSYFFTPWIKPWPEPYIYIHFVFNIVMALCVITGCFYRFTTFGLWIGVTTMFLMEKSVYINHLYLYCLLSFLLIFLPAHRACSLDVIRKKVQPSAVMPAWCLYILLFQISVVYIFAGIAKINVDWFHAVPLNLWLANKAHLPIIGPIVSAPWFAWFMSYGGVVFDLFIIPALLWQRTRVYAIAIAFVFHATNAAIFGIGSFPWLSLTMSMMFFPPSLFRKYFFKYRLPTLTQKTVYSFKPSATTITFLASYVLIQIAIPLRPWLYEGNPSYTEYGHDFSWHMMLRDKDGSIDFVVEDKNSKQTFVVDPYDYLTHNQVSALLGKPDFILQFAHFLVDEFKRRGINDVAVRARSVIKFNGRPAQDFVDSSRDLAREPLSLRPYSWLLPLRN